MFTRGYIPSFVAWIPPLFGKCSPPMAEKSLMVSAGTSRTPSAGLHPQIPAEKSRLQSSSSTTGPTTQGCNGSQFRHQKIGQRTIKFWGEWVFVGQFQRLGCFFWWFLQDFDMSCSPVGCLIYFPHGCCFKVETPSDHQKAQKGDGFGDVIYHLSPWLGATLHRDRWLKYHTYMYINIHMYIYIYMYVYNYIHIMHVIIFIYVRIHLYTNIFINIIYIYS